MYNVCATLTKIVGQNMISVKLWSREFKTRFHHFKFITKIIFKYMIFKCCLCPFTVHNNNFIYIYIYIWANGIKAWDKGIFTCPKGRSLQANRISRGASVAPTRWGVIGWCKLHINLANVTCSKNAVLNK